MLDQVFEHPRIIHGGMKISMGFQRATGGKIPLIANPMKLL
jgi:hypothetical protein